MADAEVARPEWVDDELFPFESRFQAVDGARVHYVDEGEGPVLLLLHGQPTWSFMFRHLIRGLRDRFRCIAPDYPGFGLSTAPPEYGYRIHEQVATMEGFIDALELTSFTPVMQDWGGPVGMALSVRHPERVRGFVIGNTWAWPLEEPKLKIMSAILGGPLGHLFVRRLNLFSKVLIPAGLKQRNLTDREHAMYLRPHPTPGAREPLHVMAREVRGARPLLREIEEGLHQVTDRPALILWPTADPVFTDPQRERWEALFTDHRTHMLDGAGHYLWEDAADEIVAAIREWHPDAD